MAVSCWTREEKNGLHIIFPLEGRMKQDCMIVNDTVKFVYDRLAEGVGLQELTELYLDYARAKSHEEAAEAKPLDPAHVKFDLYRTLVLLKDHEICDYGFEELLQLLPSQPKLRGRTQICPIESIAEVAELMRSPLISPNGVEVLYSYPHLSQRRPEEFGLESICRRHLDEEEVCFAQLDKRGKVEAASAVRGFGTQPEALNFTYVAGRTDGDHDFDEVLGRHIAQLCGLLSVVTLSPKIRFLVADGGGEHTSTHEVFLSLIGELGFRRAFHLPDELEEGVALAAYDKILF